MTESDRYIAELLAIAPEWSPEQRDQIRALIAPTVRALAAKRRSELARTAALTRWARTLNRREATRAATFAYLSKYLPDEFDALPDAQKEIALDCARRAHCARMRAAKLLRRG